MHKGTLVRADKRRTMLERVYCPVAKMDRGSQRERSTPGSTCKPGGCTRGRTRPNKKGAPNGDLLAHYIPGRDKTNKEMWGMPSILPGSGKPFGTPVQYIQSLTILSVGNRHRRDIPGGTGKAKIHGGHGGLLHEMDRGGTIGVYIWEADDQICMEKHHD